ncbi:MAG: DUF4435 domain-containing protein [Syntrophaceae bacterium]|nr:DUF4435 domain-containing protein [Syntrophaceae bacterium]
MKGWERRRDEIRETQVEETGKRVILVEGTDDVSVYGILMDRRFGSDFEKNWVVTYAGNKKIILDILSKENTWLGLIDRDEWTEDVIIEKQNQLPNLVVLPRFCMESYLIEPEELWKAFPENQRNKIAGGLEQLRGEVLIEKDKWLRHGVLWSVINPLWQGLRALGFKEALLDFNNAQDDARIQAQLEEWHNFLEPNQIYVSFKDRLSDVAERDETEQITRWVHGKMFFETHVNQVRNRLLGQRSLQDRKRDIFQTRALPGDLNPLWEKIEL